MTIDSSPTETASEVVRNHVDVGGVHTYYEVEGAGDPVLMLHGGFAPIETLAGLRAGLTGSYRLWLPERRAQGRTPDVDGPITYDLMAADTVAFMDAVGLESAHLVGWSDGAVVGLLVALQRPDLVRKLVMVGQNINSEGEPAELAEMRRLPEMPDMLPPMLRDLYGAVSPDGADHWPVVVDKLWQMIRVEPEIPLTELARVLAPTLVAIGDRDMATVEQAVAMQRALPDGQLAVVPGATHGLPMEKPDLLARLLSDFLG